MAPSTARAARNFSGAWGVSVNISTSSGFRTDSDYLAVPGLVCSGQVLELLIFKLLYLLCLLSVPASDQYLKTKHKTHKCLFLRVGVDPGYFFQVLGLTKSLWRLWFLF